MGHLNINSPKSESEILSSLIADTFNTFTSAQLSKTDFLFHIDVTVMIKVLRLCFMKEKH